MIFKTIRRGITAFTMLIGAAISFAPPTDSEIAALGHEPPRFELVQMRLAGAMMRIAPEFTIAQYANATGLPEHIIREHLNAKAAGRTFTFARSGQQDSQNTGWAAQRIPIPANRPPDSDNDDDDRNMNTGNRRTAAGGALFVKPD